MAKIKLGNLYGIYDKLDCGYHPYLVVAISHKKVYTIQGSSVKLDLYKNETNIFEKKGKDNYIIYDYDNKNLKYITAFSLGNFSWDKEINDKKFLGYVNERGFKEILKGLFRWDGFYEEKKEGLQSHK